MRKTFFFRNEIQLRSIGKPIAEPFRTRAEHIFVDKYSNFVTMKRV